MTGILYTPTGIAPGDGDLMPPRFAGDRKTDAQEWLQDPLDCTHVRRVLKSTGLVLLRASLELLACG